jgi:two-component system, OmpR family, osmolarity sensor histidine kinase EnvZ
MRLLPRSLFRQNLLLIVLLIILGQLASGLVFVFAVQQPRVAKLADMFASQVLAVRQAAVAMTPAQRTAFVTVMSVGDEMRVLPAESLSLDRNEFAGFDEPDNFAVRSFLRQLRQKLGGNVDIVRWQAVDRSIWIGLLLGDQPYWVTLRGGQVLPVAPWAFIAASLGATLLALLGAVWISRRINRPLAHLVAAANVMGKGERPAALDETGPHEIATVAASFNQLADDLARLDRERTVMLAGVSHDLRTPLTKLRLALDLSEARLEADLFDQMARYIDDIDGLLDQFLAFARIGSDEIAQPMEVNGLIESVLAGYARQGVSIAASLDVAPALYLRPMAFRRLLVNLLDNAIKYGESDFCVKTEVDRGCWQLSVIDGGPGIADADKVRLLQPFARANDARAGKPGAGLGLAIACRIAELHGGTLTLGGRSDHRSGLVAAVGLPLST